MRRYVLYNLIINVRTITTKSQYLFCMIHSFSSELLTLSKITRLKYMTRHYSLINASGISRIYSIVCEKLFDT